MRLLEAADLTLFNTLKVEIINAERLRMRNSIKYGDKPYRNQSA
jgi:hypothetical protein